MKTASKIIVTTIIALVLIVTIAFGAMRVLAVREFGEDTRIGRIVLSECTTDDHIVIMSPFNDGEDVFLLVWDIERGYIASDWFYGFWNNY